MKSIQQFKEMAFFMYLMNEPHNSSRRGKIIAIGEQNVCVKYHLINRNLINVSKIRSKYKKKVRMNGAPVWSPNANNGKRKERRNEIMCRCCV